MAIHERHTGKCRKDTRTSGKWKQHWQNWLSCSMMWVKCVDLSFLLYLTCSLDGNYDWTARCYHCRHWEDSCHSWGPYRARVCLRFLLLCFLSILILFQCCAYRESCDTCSSLEKEEVDMFLHHPDHLRDNSHCSWSWAGREEVKRSCTDLEDGDIYSRTI